MIFKVKQNTYLVILLKVTIFYEKKREEIEKHILAIGGYSLKIDYQVELVGLHIFHTYHISKPDRAHQFLKVLISIHLK